MLDDCLRGVLVLDLSQHLPGPLATRMLADLGADVLKVEPPAGDPLRQVPPLAEDGGGIYHALLNRGKTCTRINLKSAQGRAQFESLLARADVLFETFRPGVLDRLGFGPARRRELNPLLVHCALTGYGQNGPMRQDAGHDLNYVALCGGLALAGDQSQATPPWPPPADHAAASQAALTVVAAVLRRQTTGAGASIDVAISDSYLLWQERDLVAASLGLPQQQSGVSRLNGGAACYRIYRTRDARLVTLGALESHFWANFCHAVNHPEWIARQQDPLPQTQLIAAVQALFGSRELAYWEARLSAVECCFQPARSHAEAMQAEQFGARRILNPVQGHGVEVLYPAWLDGAPPSARKPLLEVDPDAAVASWGVSNGDDSSVR